MRVMFEEMGDFLITAIIFVLVMVAIVSICVPLLMS